MQTLLFLNGGVNFLSVEVGTLFSAASRCIFTKTSLEKCHNVAVSSKPVWENQTHANYSLSVCFYFIKCHFTRPVLTFSKWGDSGWFKLNWLLSSPPRCVCVCVCASFSLILSVSHAVVSPQVRYVIFLEECCFMLFSKGDYFDLLRYLVEVSY